MTLPKLRDEVCVILEYNSVVPDTNQSSACSSRRCRVAETMITFSEKVCGRRRKKREAGSGTGPV
jgi:hypothetical protein